MIGTDQSVDRKECRSAITEQVAVDKCIGDNALIEKAARVNWRRPLLRVAGFTSKWTGFVNTGRHLGTNSSSTSALVILDSATVTVSNADPSVTF
jgi:hypothetical protein